MLNLIGNSGNTVHAATPQGDRWLCQPNGYLNADFLPAARTSRSANCGNCQRRIAKVHKVALELNELVNEGIAKAEQMLAEYGEHNFNSVSTDRELTDMLELQRGWLATDLDTASDYLSPTMRKNLVSRAHLVTIYQAELDFRIELHKADRARTQQAKADAMVTENNYGEQGSCRCPATHHHLDCPQRPKPTGDRAVQQPGPFHFTDHPHDQVRAQRYDSIINTLTEMVANANRPVPTTEQLIEAIIGLEHGEAIEEDRARFPYPSFTRFALPVPCGYRHEDGTIERGVYIIGSDVSRRIYKQNVVLIARSQGPAQVVAEGDLVS